MSGQHQHLFFSDAENPASMIKHDTDAALIDGVPHLSPLLGPMVFSYPVHKIGQHFQPHQPSADPVCLVVYRNRADQVRVLELQCGDWAYVGAFGTRCWR